MNTENSGAGGTDVNTEGPTQREDSCTVCEREEAAVQLRETAIFTSFMYVENEICRLLQGCLSTVLRGLQLVTLSPK